MKPIHVDVAARISVNADSTYLILHLRASSLGELLPSLSNEANQTYPIAQDYLGLS